MNKGNNRSMSGCEVTPIACAIGLWLSDLTNDLESYGGINFNVFMDLTLTTKKFKFMRKQEILTEQIC